MGLIKLVAKKHLPGADRFKEWLVWAPQDDKSEKIMFHNIQK